MVKPVVHICRVLVFRVANMKVPPIQARQASCFDCGERVWVSDCTARDLNRRGMLLQPCCSHCWRKKDHPVAGVAGEESYREVLRAVRKAVAARN